MPRQKIHHMGALGISLDILQLEALTALSVKLKRSRSRLVRDIVYAALAQYREDETLPRAGIAPTCPVFDGPDWERRRIRDGKLVDVDDWGLVVETETADTETASPAIEEEEENYEHEGKWWNTK